MTRVLITGGRGLLGGRLASHLAGTGCLVRVASRERAATAARLPGADIVWSDWDDETSLAAMCRDVDVVVNAMGMNAADCAADPVAALTVNGVYTARLLRAAIGAGVRRFIHFSTAHVYGNLQGVISEEACPSNPHPYAATHHAGEQAVLWADRAGQIEGAVLRLSNAFGRPHHPDANCWMLLANDLCRQAVTRRRLTLLSDGRQHRDFIPLGSVCGLVDRLCGPGVPSSFKRSPDAPPVFNVGRGKSISVLAMAQLVQSRCPVVLGYPVGLDRPAPSDPGAELPGFRYVSATLAEPPPLVEENFVPEIDELLLFCRDHFSAS